MVRALIVEKAEDGAVSAHVGSVEESELPEGDTLVDVSFSTLNYKDGLCLTGGGGLVRSYPHVPGVDFVGEVAETSHADLRHGQPVILTGWRVGETRWGGYAERARVKGEWLVPLPEGLAPRRAMAIGTAGLTAMLAIMALEDHGLTPGAGPVLVTGASGGVGSVATALLSRLGHEVHAVTGRPEQADYLKRLGAAEIVPREELAEAPKKPLESERWAGGVDAVGGATLARALTQMRYGASVAAVGLAGGAQLPATVIPFILRGVNLLGIDSVMRPRGDRVRAWSRLARDLDMEKLDAMTETVGLDALPELGRRILKGGVRGRVVVDVRA